MSPLVPILVTAFALALDAFAVSVAAGMAVGRASHRDALRLALCFGGFQAGMAVLGIGLGSGLRPFVEGYAPAIAGIVLIGLGGYAIRKALSDAEDAETLAYFSTPVLLSLGLATSLDAAAAGVSIGMGGRAIPEFVVATFAATFGLCLGGVHLADSIERLVGPRAELAGGLALVGLGVMGLIDAAAAF